MHIVWYCYACVMTASLHCQVKNTRAPGEDRTHDLQISLWSTWIMRLTRCLLRYRGRCNAGEFKNWWISTIWMIHCVCAKLVVIFPHQARKAPRTPGQWRYGHDGIHSQTNTCLTPIADVEQSGAVEACWAHNPEVRRSKLRSAKYPFSRWKLTSD